MLLFTFTSSNLQTSPSRTTTLSKLLSSTLSSQTLSPILKPLLLYLFLVLLYANILGNIPSNFSFTMYYSLVATISLTIWLAIFISMCYSDIQSFVAHLVPTGSPVALMLFLPLIELFSQFIRPLTLIIRLSTNLAAGHIMLFIFSYFSTLVTYLAPSLYLVLYLLFFLELAVSILQSYIFVSLIVLYLDESWTPSE